MSPILFVDAGTTLPPALERHLRADGFAPEYAACEAAMDLLRRQRFHAVVLDISHTGSGCLACCKRLRACTDAPLVLVTAPGDAHSRIVGLQMGADDSLSHPYEPRELCARLRAASRARARAAAPDGRRIDVDGLVVDECRREVTLCGRRVALTRREYAVLAALAGRARTPMDRGRLFEAVWGYDSQLAGKLLDVYIHRLRRKIEEDPLHPRFIFTVRGCGYRLGE